MKVMRAAVMAATLAALAQWAPASAQSPEFANSKVVIFELNKGDRGYWAQTHDGKPLSAEHMALRERMIKRNVLQDFAEFLSPLRLPHTLRLFASDCSGGAWDSPNYNYQLHFINMCYSFVGSSEKAADLLLKFQSERKLWTPVSREQLIAGLFAAVLLHEAGHAVFDLMEVPIFGREEDAADQMAAFIALQFSKETARTIIKGFAYFWALNANPNTTFPDPNAPDYPTDPEQQCMADPFCAYSDEHGTGWQRMFNTLCIAYGGDPENFKDLVEANWLPADRAKNCKNEFDQLRYAFSKTVLPFIDQAQMAKVKARTWFQPQEMKEN
jgi:hypothetical protein